MKERGFSLIEMLIVLALVGLIVGIAVPLGLAVVRSSRAESQIQSIYANLAEARQRAVQNSVTYLIQVTDKSVLVFADTSKDGVADAGEEVSALSVDWSPPGSPFKYDLAGTVGVVAIGGTATTFQISRRGIIDRSVKMRLSSSGNTQDARLNCIEIGYTRIGIGKYVGSTCTIQ